MARLLWALTCRRAITDRETNNVSYIDAIEQISVKRIPTVFGAQICVSSLWQSERENERLVVRHRLMAPSGKKVSACNAEPIEMSKPRYRFNLVFSGFRIDEEGEFRFEIAAEVAGAWKTVGTLPVSVAIAVPPAGKGD